MPDVQTVVLSDLHFGAENSVLTELVPGRYEVDTSRAGEVMTRLVECLHTLIGANESTKRPTLVLGGDVLELALAEDHVAAMVFERFIELAFSGPDRLFAEHVYYVPGNHDHHLWEGARERHYADYVRSLPPEEPLPPPWHATRLLARADTEPMAAPLLTSLIQRRPELRDVRVQTVYPNLGLISERGDRAVVYHHGHYVESIYRLVSTLRQLMFHRSAPQRAWEWEAQNFAWVDFFWSTLGRSGEAGQDVHTAYDLRQSPAAAVQLVHNLVYGLAERIGVTRLRRRVLNEIAELLVKHGAKPILSHERLHPDAVLSADARRGLREYVEGPVRLALADEYNDDAPEQVTFLFGHTHKPFALTSEFSGYRAPVMVANTGGWMVDTVKPLPLHGAAEVLLDEDLNSVLLRMYNQQDDAADYRVAVEPVPGSADSDFARRLTALIDPESEPWRSFSKAVGAAVRARGLELAGSIERASTAACAPSRTAGVDL